MLSSLRAATKTLWRSNAKAIHQLTNSVQTRIGSNTLRRNLSLLHRKALQANTHTARSANLMIYQYSLISMRRVGTFNRLNNPTSPSTTASAHRHEGSHHTISSTEQTQRNTSTSAEGSSPPKVVPFENIYAYEERRQHESEHDAKVIFELIFAEISQKLGGDQNMTFPKDIMWLCGAPGSGKGEMSQWIMYQRGYHADPIKISAILRGTEIERLKAEGKLISDRIVLTILLEKLLLPEYRTGVIVDGFPRTYLQAEFIKLLFDKMLYLRRKYDGTAHFAKFRRPKFHITVLYVDEEISVQRQLHRGQAQKEHNELVTKTGHGELIAIRDTDLNEARAKERYQHFHEHIYQSIQSVKEKFPFHFISAEAPIEEVKQRILVELEYQSDSELGDNTFDMVRQISLASEIKLDARHKLVTRLDSYALEQNKDIFQEVINVFKYEFEPLVRQQALMGTCIISTEKVNWI